MCSPESLGPSDVVTLPSGSSRLPPPDSRLPTRATAPPRIKNSCPFFSSGEQTFGTIPFHSASVLESQTPARLGVLLGSERTEDSGAFLQAQRHFCLGEVQEEGSEGEVGSNFLHCGSGQLYFIQQAPRPPRTTLSQPPPAQ